MKKNKEEFIESYQNFPKFLYQSIYYKESETAIYNSRIYIKNRTKMKTHNPKYFSKELLYNIFNSPLYCLYNKVGANFIKLIGIYQLIILHFHVAMATGSGNAEVTCEKAVQGTLNGWGIENYLCKMCNGFKIIGIDCDSNAAVPISVTAFFFSFVIGIFCLICCNCCCKKSCCKKKKSEEGDVDYSSYMMGPDGQMYNLMYQGQMMSPQMYQMGMMQPQMFPGQMMYPQMYPGGIQDPGMQMQGMQMQGMQMPGMQMPGMHNEEMQNQ